MSNTSIPPEKKTDSENRSKSVKVRTAATFIIVLAAKTAAAIENYNHLSGSLFFVEFVGEDPRSEFGKEHHRLDAGKWPKKRGWRHGRCCLTCARLQGCGMVLNLTASNCFSTARRLGNGSSCSWPFRITQVNFQIGEVVSLTSQTLPRGMFFAVGLTVFLLNFNLVASPLDITIVDQIRAYDFGVKFFFNPLGFHARVQSREVCQTKRTGCIRK